MTKIIARIKGGLGNQLFCYAAARRLALVNNAELVIDDVSGFVRDKLYKRQYALKFFNISARMATPAERLEPFERYRRALLKLYSRSLSLDRRPYIEQEHWNFDPRLLTLQLRGEVHLDGVWMSEAYFSDIKEIIQKDLIMQPPLDKANQAMAAKIAGCDNSVGLHLRWLDASLGKHPTHNVHSGYYEHAVNYVQSHLGQSHLFIFSNDPEAAATHLCLPIGSYTVVSNNLGDDHAYADLWLMNKCQHIITANSSLSWWAAWLGSKKNNLVITPNPEYIDGPHFWQTKDLIPKEWLKL